MGNTGTKPKKIKKVDINLLASGFISLMREYSRFMISWGEVETKHGNIIKKFEEMSKSPKLLNAIMKKASPETAGLMIKLFLRMGAITPRMDNFLNLSPNDKISLGKELAEIVEEFEDVLNRLRRRK